jgi:ABC-type transport system involved in cytochrome c biogenesis permease subunit
MKFNSRKSKGVFFIVVPPGISLVAIIGLAAIRVIIESRSSGAFVDALEWIHIAMAFVVIFVIIGSITYGSYLVVGEFFKLLKKK